MFISYQSCTPRNNVNSTFQYDAFSTTFILHKFRSIPIEAQDYSSTLRAYYQNFGKMWTLYKNSTEAAFFLQKFNAFSCLSYWGA